MNFKNKKLASNPGIILSLLFIFFCLFLSVFSYQIIPDKSVNSNQMHLPIHSQKPGFIANFIIVPDKEAKKQSTLSKYFSGFEYPNNEILISEFTQIENGIEYLDFSNEKKIISFDKFPDISVLTI